MSYRRRRQRSRLKERDDLPSYISFEQSSTRNSRPVPWGQYRRNIKNSVLYSNQKTSPWLGWVLFPTTTAEMEINASKKLKQNLKKHNGETGNHDHHKRICKKKGPTAKTRRRWQTWRTVNVSFARNVGNVQLALLAKIELRVCQALEWVLLWWLHIVIWDTFSD